MSMANLNKNCNKNINLILIIKKNIGYILKVLKIGLIWKHGTLKLLSQNTIFFNIYRQGNSLTLKLINLNSIFFNIYRQVSKF